MKSWIVPLFWLLTMAIGIGFWVGVIYVGIHFIQKFW